MNINQRELQATIFRELKAIRQENRIRYDELRSEQDKINTIVQSIQERLDCINVHSHLPSLKKPTQKEMGRDPNVAYWVHTIAEERNSKLGAGARCLVFEEDIAWETLNTDAKRCITGLMALHLNLGWEEKSWGEISSNQKRNVERMIEAAARKPEIAVFAQCAAQWGIRILAELKQKSIKRSASRSIRSEANHPVVTTSIRNAQANAPTLASPIQQRPISNRIQSSPVCEHPQHLFAPTRNPVTNRFRQLQTSGHLMVLDEVPRTSSGALNETSSAIFADRDGERNVSEFQDQVRPAIRNRTLLETRGTNSIPQPHNMQRTADEGNQSLNLPCNTNHTLFRGPSDHVDVNMHNSSRNLPATPHRIYPMPCATTERFAHNLNRSGTSFQDNIGENDQIRPQLSSHNGIAALASNEIPASQVQRTPMDEQMQVTTPSIARNISEQRAANGDPTVPEFASEHETTLNASMTACQASMEIPAVRDSPIVENVIVSNTRNPSPVLAPARDTDNNPANRPGLVGRSSLRGAITRSRSLGARRGRRGTRRNT